MCKSLNELLNKSMLVVSQTLLNPWINFVVQYDDVLERPMHNLNRRQHDAQLQFCQSDGIRVPPSWNEAAVLADQHQTPSFGMNSDPAKTMSASIITLKI